MHIEVRKLGKSFGSFQAIRDVSFQIQKGHLVGLLGPSGGGKTSILRMLAGLETPTAGEIYLDGKLANPLSVQDRGIGFVFQNYALFKHMNVFDNVAYGLRVKKQGKKAIRERVDFLLKLMGLDGTQRKYPHQLSGGQRQRVAFARALAPEPKLLLLDEPFSAIDAKVRKELRVWLRNLISEFGITTIFVTHDQDEAIEVADDLIIVQGGSVEQQGTPWQIYNEPASAFVASFVGESNRWARPFPLNGFTSELAPYWEDDHWRPGVDVFIRPEAVDIRPADTTILAHAGEPATITHVHYRGDSWYVEFELRDHAKWFAYHTVNELVYRPGDAVNVLIHQVIVFTTEGTRVLENRSKEDPMPVYI